MLADWQMNMWAPVINLFGFIPSFGFMIIVFTICLKLVLSPLDFFNRKISRASSLKQAQIQPKVEKLRKQIKDPKILQQKTMELYKREGYNIYGSCLFMLLNLIVTLFIFITLWSGLSQMSEAKILNQYEQINETFNDTFYTELKKTDEYQGMNDDQIRASLKSKIDSYRNEAIQNLEIDTSEELTDEQERKIMAEQVRLTYTKDFSAQTETAQKAASAKYEEIKDNWLWIDSIWRPDTYVSGYPSYSDFANIVHLDNMISSSKTSEEDKKKYEEYQITYDVATARIQSNYSSWNGYFILVVLAGGVTYLSFVITQLVTSKKRKEQNPTAAAQSPMGGMKIMKFLMPALMVIFTFNYSAAFALYIVMNSIMSTILSFGSLKILEKMDNNKNNTPEVQNKKLNDRVEYSR